MPLPSGLHLGLYEIAAALGAGGMGEVYRAKDTKLGRDVALKILPASFTSDPERVARFRREAQVLASLNHPHIAQIYGLEEASGTQFLVLELVDGESLDKRIARGPIPVDEALGIAKQIAEALEAAHEKGIIHRDLKPANVALTKDGSVKVLDFGLAKAAEATSGASADAMNSPTITSPAMMTGVGVILGTAAYMSPEQAKGRAADKRSDIWAFGCVLYEMLTGNRAFDGDDVSDTLAAVLRGEPDWTGIPADVSLPVRTLVQGCLEKNRAVRPSDIAVARFVLTHTTKLTDTISPPHVLPPVPSALRRYVMPMAVGVALTAAVASIAWWRFTPEVPGRAVTRFAIALPEHQRLASRSQVLAISPDGSRVVYAANAPVQLYLRSMAEMEAHPISGTNLDVMSPFFSPDGQWIGFYSFQDGTLKKIAVSGGAAVTICKSTPPHGVAWDGDWIVFADEGEKGVLRVSPNGGEPEVIASVKPGETFGAPHLFDDGKLLLFTVATGGGLERWDRAQIVVQRVGSTERLVVLRGGSEGRYVPTGHLVYMLANTLLAVPFDSKTWQVRGGPVPIVEGVRRFDSTANRLPDASIAFSRTGSLVYLTGSAITGGAQRTVALATRDGQQQPLNLPPRPYVHPRVSPDGKQLAIQTDDGNDAIIWIYDLRGGSPPRRLTFGGRNTSPIWGPEGRVTFHSDREGDHGLFWQLADGTKPADRLLKADAASEYRPDAWSPDGKTLMFSVVRGSTTTLSTLSGGVVKPWATDIRATHATFSSDGKWLAYVSTEAGNRTEIFVQDFQRTGAKYQVSTEGGTFPVWSPDGTQLFYWPLQRQGLVGVDVQTRPSFSYGKSAAQPIEAIFTGAPRRNYDIMPDGKQFVVIRPADVSADANSSINSQISVVTNWFEELKARVPVK